MSKLLKGVILLSFIIGSFFSASIGYCEEEKPKQIPESEKLKMEIRALIESTKAKNDKARKLFIEAKTTADSLKQEADQKLKYLGETIKKAQKSKAVDKKELAIAVKLNTEAKKLYKENEYIKVIAKVNEALKHISKVPVVSITVSPQLFTPGKDRKTGKENILTITPDIFSINKVKSWILAISKKEEGEKKGVEIKKWTGEGDLTEPIKWDGKSKGKTILDSASSYVARLVVKDEKNGIGGSSEVRFKTDIFVIETARGKLINISSIRFDYNKDDLKPKYKKTVKMVHDFLLNYPGYNIIVEGHSDSSGKALKNKTLAAQRAKSVADYLVELGMDRTRIKESGLGEALPIYYTKKMMALNRRVSFILLKTKEDTEKYENYIKKLNFEKEVEMRK